MRLIALLSESNSYIFSFSVLCHKIYFSVVISFKLLSIVNISFAFMIFFDICLFSMLFESFLCFMICQFLILSIKK
nr:MAG TPA: hypothetical protein [Bacteriophage sp.]